MPMRVLTTGALIILASSMTSWDASIAPPPTSMSGRLDSLIHCTASWSPDRSSVSGLTPNFPLRRDLSMSAFIWSMGRSMWTGPFLPIWHISHASLTAWGSLLTSRTL